MRTACCIAGGGPAGVMLGYLLARSGVEVMVLEKHADFFRDFRGDTIHPSTLEVLNELGLLDEFLKLPHNEDSSVGAQIGPFKFTVADFSHLPTRCKFIAFTPQWDFLNFLVGQGKKYPFFHLKLEHMVTGLLRDTERVIGVRAETPEGPVEIIADLVIGADGRGSLVREQSGLAVTDLGAPFDVLWMRVSRHPDDPLTSLGNFQTGRGIVMINRQDYWQCGFLIAKGSLPRLKEEGIGAFQQNLSEIAPFLKERVRELDNWEKIKLLTVQVNHLEKWYSPGLLCIGDAAHAMSPVGGVGVNLAVQDAVAAANLLTEALRSGRVAEAILASVEKRRLWPALMTQRFQVFIQDQFLLPVLQGEKEVTVPLVARLLSAFPLLQRIPARLLGLGIRPEHVNHRE